MDDQDFIEHVEHEIRSRFFAPFDGRDLFNDSLITYILDLATASTTSAIISASGSDTPPTN